MENVFVIDARVFHPNLGYGKVFDTLGATTVVNFDDNRIKPVHSRLLRLVSEDEVIKQEKPETKAHKSRRLRNEHIVSLLHEGLRYRKVAKLCKVSPSTVKNVALANGIDYLKDKKNKIFDLIAQVKQDIENGLNYYEIKLNNKLTSQDIKDMRYHGFLVIREFKAKRNHVITDKYKSGVIAKKLISKKLKEVGSIGRVYGVVSNENKVYRYPKIKRGYKGLFEDKEVINIITKLKKKKFTCVEIAGKLNEAGYRTPYGLKYDWHHVQHRVNKINCKKHKIKKLLL